MAPHSSTLAWKIPWMEESGRLQSMGSLSWTRLSDFTFTFHFHASEKEMATHSSVLAWRIPGMGSLVGCCLWGRTESDRTEATQQQQQQQGQFPSILGSWSQYSHSKGSGLDLWSRMEIPQVIMALNEIKTNIQKSETKYEPQTNGSYKIWQILIKIMEYAHIHIHP